MPGNFSDATIEIQDYDKADRKRHDTKNTAIVQNRVA